MNNSMNILRRLMAFLLALLLVTTMVGDDFYTRAEGEVIESTEESGGEESAAAPEEGGGSEYTAPEGEAPVEEVVPADVTGDITGEPGVDGEVPGQDNTGIENPVIVDENGNIITPENGDGASNQNEANNDANNPNTIDTPSDETNTNNNTTVETDPSDEKITEEETETPKGKNLKRKSLRKKS